ncbi:MAG: ABC-F family ATP-binding cassette domain-containing protein [Bacteroidales bacterium]|jgi:ATP-binding cassette subfamily F protein 3|nr:ABC-F family ATP-binding cassette domain-containing protein [Bacteroidales bacterium]
MIALNKIAINFTGDFLFKELTFVAGDRDRIGLVGKNGAGKSTLLKVIHHELEPEAGTITITSGFKTGYLPQQIEGNYHLSVKQEAMLAFEEQQQLERKIKDITHLLSTRADYESEEYIQLAQQLSDNTDRFQQLGGNTMEGNTERVLLGLGFKHSDFSKPMQEFSIGWKMRVNLAKILLQKPEIILLDEPTNHLDIEAIQWLEEYLSNYDGCLILVSHDRTFLDKVTNRTIEIVFGAIQDYKCSYSEYVQQRLERIESQQSAFDNQQKQIADVEKFIERFRYKATKAKQVQSRLKLLDKMDKIEVEQMDKSSIFFKFPPAPHSGRVVEEAHHLTLGYGAHKVLNDIDFTIERGERIAFVGKNGEGKSTMVKAIVGELSPLGGKIASGHNVIIGYYAQNQSLLLDPEKTVFETIDHIAIGDIRPKIRSILGSFLFDSDDIEKKVKVLSGGEKSRLALAKLLLSPFNLLILDEPTNHLDMQSKDVLKNALLQYTGSMILVSHDRDFLQGLSEKVIEFKDGSIKTYIGDVFDFLDKKKLDTLNELQKQDQQRQNQNNNNSSNKKKYIQKKEEDAQQRKIQNKISKLEREISDLIQQLQTIEVQLSDPEVLAEKIDFNKLLLDYESIKNQIINKEEEWIELQ